MMKKRMLSLCLIGALTLGSVAPAQVLAASDNVGEVVDDPSADNGENTGDAELPFLDVAESSWYYDAVVYVYQKGLMTGTSTTTFAPGATTTRGMIVSVLYRQAGSPEVSDEMVGTPFEDVGPGAWYADAVYWARANGIVNGYSETSFGPNDVITREQMAAILYNYSAFTGADVSARADLSAYDDASAIAAWAREALEWANAEGLITGMTATTIAPKESATRAQVAAILQRYLDDGSEEPEPPTPDAETVRLVIGLPDAMTTVETTLEENTPQALIAALAEETGWDLTLAQDVTSDENGIATVALASGSSLYGAALGGVAADDWPFYLCNSIAETLQANGAAGVRFTAPDGGKLVVENANGRFCLMPGFVWNYDLAVATNTAQSDALTPVIGAPNGQPVPTGTDTLLLIFPADGVTAQSGSLTVYDADGNVAVRLDVSDAIVVDGAEMGLDPEAYNFESATTFSIPLSEGLAPGSYSVHVDPASFAAPDGRLSEEILRDSWNFEVAAYGVSGSTLPDETPTILQLGQTYSMDIAIDGSDCDKAVVTCKDAYITSDTAILTASGSITLTPQQASDGEVPYLVTITFYKGDTPVGTTVLNASIQ